MPDLKTQFETAAARSPDIAQTAGRQDPAHPVRLLQAGHPRGCDRRRPGGFDMVGKAKYDAWAKLKGTSQEMAMQAYVEVVRRLREAPK